MIPKVTEDYFQTTDGGRLYYQVSGEGEAIIFIHGFSLDHRMWQPQIEHFSKNYKVITYDARGFGKSSLPDGTYSPYQDAKDLLDHLGVTQAHVIGLSMGGGIATELTLSYPKLVLSLTLVDSDLHGYANEVDWKVHHPRITTLEQAKENWLNHELFAGTKHPASLTLIKEIVHDYSGWHWENKDERAHVKPSARRQLSNISAPTLILVGEHDLVYFHNIARVLHDGIASSRLEVIKNAGHMVNLEAQDDCNRLLERHLNFIR